MSKLVIVWSHRQDEGRPEKKFCRYQRLRFENLDGDHHQSRIIFCLSSVDSPCVQNNESNLHYYTWLRAITFIKKESEKSISCLRWIFLIPK